MGPLGQPPKVGGAILEPLMPFETNRGFTDLRTGGPRWHPPLLGGGGRFVASLLVNLLVLLANVLVII